MFNSTIGKIIVGLIVLALAGSAAQAEDRNWINGAGGNYAVGTNWDTGVPASSDDAFFGLEATYGVNLLSDQSVNRFFQTDGSITLTGGFALQSLASSSVESGVDRGTLTLTGAGTRLDVAGIFRVGSGTDNDGTLNIFNGAQVNAGVAWIGRSNGGSNGTVRVNGSDSQWNVVNSVQLGFFGNGMLQIENGGLASAGSMSIGSRPGRTGVLEVSGANSKLTVNGSGIDIAGEGSGTMTIQNGGEVNSNGASVGFGPSSVGSVRVTGANSRWISTQLTLGQLGSGTLNIDNAGQVTATDVNLSNTSGSSGTLNVSSGGVLNSTTGSIGGIGGGTGTAVVTAANSQWNTMANLRIGTLSSGMGSLQVAGGGAVSVGGEGLVNTVGSLTVSQASFTTANGTTNRGSVIIDGDSIIGGAFAAELGSSTQITNNSVGTFQDKFFLNGGQVLTDAGSTTRFLGEVTGVGLFAGQGNLVFEGSMDPGSSPGLFEFENNVSFADTATLMLELGGLNLTQFDRLNFQNDVAVDGQLSVLLINDFELAGNQEFLIANVGGMLSGQFVGLSEGSFVGNYGGQDLFISYARGSGNDIALFTTAVPEPSVTGVIGWACLAGVLRRRRRNVA